MGFCRAGPGLIPKVYAEPSFLAEVLILLDLSIDQPLARRMNLVSHVIDVHNVHREQINVFRNVLYVSTSS